MKQFVFKILAVSIVLALIGWLIFKLFIPEYYIHVLPFALLFFMTITILVHAWQLRMLKKDLAKFTRSNMLVTFFKLIIYSVFAIGYIAIKPNDALVFVIGLFILYTTYSFIEVTEINKVSNKK